MNDTEKASSLLGRQGYMVVAVVLEDGTPWAVPVKIQARDGWSLEWDSRVDTVHSQAIEVRPETAVTIYEKSGDTQTGLCMSGRTGIVSRRGDDYARYRFTPDRVWINDETFTKREIAL